MYFCKFLLHIWGVPFAFKMSNKALICDLLCVSELLASAGSSHNREGREGSPDLQSTCQSSESSRDKYYLYLILKLNILA